MSYDFRSDTVTHPTSKMREAMANAPVGDDVYGDDSTVNQLQTEAARLLGKEAALFVPTGTFGNQLALLTHCARGNEVIIAEENHIVWHETGAAAVISGVNLRTVETGNGVLSAEAVRKRIRPDDIHAPKTGLICLENAHSNGRVIPLADMKAVFDVAKEHDIPVHLDGARIFNAAVSLGCSVKEIAQYSDSVMLCLSKGLASPLGSILAGSKSFIECATRNRKLMGGGMRQVGIIAAAGLLSLSEMVDRLPEDHLRAKELAKRLAQIPELDVLSDDVQINMVFFRLPENINLDKLMAAFAGADLKVNPPEDGLMRLVTHWQIDEQALDTVVNVIKDAVAHAK